MVLEVIEPKNLPQFVAAITAELWDRPKDRRQNGFMGRRKKRENEEMWEEAVRLRDRGLTFSRVRATFFTSEYRKRYNLGDIPSEDTVRREVGARIDARRCAWSIPAGTCHGTGPNCKRQLG